MKNLYCDFEDLTNESDVEQKFIYKFLTSVKPIGLGYNDSDIKTKSTLQAYCINKGKQQKYFVPDYLVVLNGLSPLVVEAKKPEEDLNEAYAEARLYANEINAKFPHNTNLCNKIICSNGNETWVGYSDNKDPIIKLKFLDFASENKQFNDFLNFCSKEKIKHETDQYYIKIRGKAQYKSPISELGKVQNEELEENSYGRNLVFDYHHIFDPDTEEDRKLIVENAYIKSPKREQHIEPIYKELKKLSSPSFINSILIGTDNSVEIVQKLNETISNKERITNSLMLLIGNAGCGKSTFIRYFKEVILSKQYPDTSCFFDWVFLNMNDAPINETEIYDWLKSNVIKNIKKCHSDINFDDFSTIEKIFKKTITNFENGIGSLLKDNTSKYNEEKYNILKTQLEDKNIYLENLIKYVADYHKKRPIIVLDNSDKRTETEQLLMFQVAQWLRSTFKCIVFLPLRDVTYDKYKKQPPIDTVVKDLIFRIDPADLLKVLQARFEYICRLSDTQNDEYIFENGIRVPIKKGEQIIYFKAILNMIRNNRWAKTIFYNLSNGNIREAIQLFEDFCKSGHILAEDIFAIKALDGNYNFPSFKLLNALIRKNRKYFNEEFSNFTNLFYSDNNDDLPDPFIRIDILLWLKDKRKDIGPAGVKGFHRISNLINDLQTMGHVSEIAYREIKALTARGLILSESNNINYNTLIRISSSGVLHLNLLSNISYLAACSENILYKNNEVMTEIAKRLTNNNYLDKLSLYQNVNAMYNYLVDYRINFLSTSNILMNENCQSNIYDLNNINIALERTLKDNDKLSDLIKIQEKYKNNQEILCIVINKNNNSLLCHINEDDVRGFLAINEDKYNFSISDYESINEGDYLICKILEYNPEHNSFFMEYMTKV